MPRPRLTIRLLRSAARLLPGALLCLSVNASATPPSASEEAVKAAYVFNFIKFAEWPSEALPQESGTIRLCTDAEGGMRGAIDDLGGRSAKGLALQVTDLPPRGLKDCHVALIEQAENLSRLNTGLPVLTIHSDGESPGIIRLFREGRRLRFAVDLGAAQRSGIRLSAKLLGVAAEVIE
jgi:hypothetical protein